MTKLTNMTCWDIPLLACFNMEASNIVFAEYNPRLHSFKLILVPQQPFINQGICHKYVSWEHHSLVYFVKIGDFTCYACK